jgi:F0F1-type ATP synthase epsilon subunit
LDKNVPARLPVANQGVAFVTSAVHTVSAGSYSMDLQLGFINVLDPSEIRAQVDQAVRKYKADSKNAAALKKKKADAAAKKKKQEQDEKNKGTGNGSGSGGSGGSGN